MSFAVEAVETGENELTLKLSGIIDEYSRLPNSLNFSKLKTLNIDFQGISYLNSGGIKMWIRYSEQFVEFPEMNVVFHNCNNMVIDQVNKTLGFVGPTTTIASALLPVFCDQCEASFEVPYVLDGVIPEDEDVINKVDKTDCSHFPSCKKKWEVDYIRHDYFHFLEKKEEN